jgi:hypothetical protein
MVTGKLPKKQLIKSCIFLFNLLLLMFLSQFKHEVSIANGRHKKMNRHIVLIVVLATMLLNVQGCEQEHKKAAMPSPAARVELQPAEAQKPVEAKRSAPPEPNVQELKTQPAEANAPQPRPTPEKPNPATQLCDRCTQLLNTFVDQQGAVDYKTLSRKRLKLLEVLDKFRDFSRDEYNSLSKEDKLAFWINGYNLEFIKIILDNYPIESSRVLRLFWPPNSIQHIKGLWDQHKFIIINEEFTLQEINKRFFQKEFDDPRVFFAICYGSVSGPPLRNEAYCGPNLSEQLDAQVKRSLASGKVLRIEHESKNVFLSAILKDSWYGQQFFSKYGTDLRFKQQTPEVRAALNFLTNYISPQDVDFLETANYTVEFMRYDWTLNEGSSQ